MEYIVIFLLTYINFEQLDLDWDHTIMTQALSSNKCSHGKDPDQRLPLAYDDHTQCAGETIRLFKPVGWRAQLSVQFSHQLVVDFFSRREAVRSHLELRIHQAPSRKYES